MFRSRVTKGQPNKKTCNTGEGSEGLEDAELEFHASKSISTGSIRGINHSSKAMCAG